MGQKVAQIQAQVKEKVCIDLDRYWIYKPEYKSFGLAFKAFFDENVLELWQKGWSYTEYTDEEKVVLHVVLLSYLCFSLIKWYYESFLQQTYPCRESYLDRLKTRLSKRQIKRGYKKYYTNLRLPKSRELRQRSISWLKTLTVYNERPGWLPYAKQEAGDLIFRSLCSGIYQPKISEIDSSERELESIENTISQLNKEIDQLKEQQQKLENEWVDLCRMQHRTSKKWLDKYNVKELEYKELVGNLEQKLLEKETKVAKAQEKLDDPKGDLATLTKKREELKQHKSSLQILKSSEIFDFEQLERHATFLKSSGYLNLEQVETMKEIAERFEHQDFPRLASSIFKLTQSLAL